ncbi:bifunctional homocysteine S-methyltransferase/methylenetetrahydrofolate reductase [Vagococcus entomophilus]|uniref:Bifunctional homocysteine S-methyltransferase/methylenetetrahydrofolate reductase n=1 Tax=Vagococcus entomophilus TaxID=1160095 RepID=A0A430AJ97_9ENTE|nr:bifunctional homocysteine S-methyltransferase/methylenetetrahydrofolate reductase [Vagococcus entomophilus]RSU08182.1 bifunctional homocysteine S-methyltransferase/methylenetetrahydrofolate reductase [Vagococcus entomophilus]
MGESLREALSKRVLVADGAMGTLLYQFGTQRSVEELNLSHPESIQKIHEEYIKAGADMIQTNTYAANYLKLERYGLQEKVLQINKAAVENAKAARKNHSVFILGTIGGIYSPGERKLNEASIEEIKRSFKEQLYALLLAGVDGILLETYYDLNELCEMLKVAKEATDLPIIANVTMQEIGVLSSGVTLEHAFEELQTLGADVVGANCLLGPSHMVQVFERVPLKQGRRLACYPNASLPAIENGTIIYEKGTAHFALCSEQLRQEGVSIIGGCCGTTPAHTKAICQGLKTIEIVKQKEGVFSDSKPISNRKKEKGKRICEKVKETCTILVELDPPRTLDTARFFEGIEALQKVQVDKITISDNSLARPRISNLALAAILKHRYQISPLIHLTTRDHNLIGLTAEIMGLHELGIFDVLAVTGDPARVGDFPGASSVRDISSLGLIKMIKQFNQGIAYTGKHLVESSDFRVAAAFNPNVAKVERAVQVIKKKQEAGADYIITQPVYDRKILARFAQSLKEAKIDLPIFIGIQPLTSSRNAEFIHHEVPGISLTDEVRERLQHAEQPKSEGIQIAKELIDEIALYFNGFYLVTPFQEYPLSVELVKYIQSKKRS